MLTIKCDTSGVEKMLGDLSHKLPSALARGLTSTAWDVRNQVKGWLPRLLDRPTAWTMNSLFVFPAEKEDLRAAVAFKSEMGRLPRRAMGNTTAARSMRAQVYGGKRDLKESEKSLLANNITSSSRPYLIPAKGARLDKYGNVTGAFMNRVLYSGVARGSASYGYSRPMSNSARTKKPKASPYFVMYRDGEPTGIYQRKGKASPMPVFIFAERAMYRRRVPFEQITTGVANRQLAKRIKESVDVIISKYR